MACVGRHRCSLGDELSGSCTRRRMAYVTNLSRASTAAETLRTNSQVCRGRQPPTQVSTVYQVTAGHTPGPPFHIWYVHDTETTRTLNELLKKL